MLLWIIYYIVWDITESIVSYNGNDWDYEFSQEIEIPLDIINNSDLNDDECPLLAEYCTSLNDKILQDKELAKTERKLKQYQKLKEELKL